MALIKKGMSINCRTKEELEVFEKIAVAEGHRWSSGKAFSTKGRGVPISFQIGYFTNCQYPRDITYAFNDMNFTGEGFLANTMTVIEASELFRNHLISRRAKHERNSTE